MPDSLSYERAKVFRKRMTPPEARLWVQLRRSRFAGYKFRRQHPAGPYILDVYCAAARLAVEVDGGSLIQKRPSRMTGGGLHGWRRRG